MFHYTLPYLPNVPHVSCQCRGSYLVATPEELENEQILTDDALYRICYTNRLDFNRVKVWHVKYSIRGSVLSDGSDVHTILLKYPTLKLVENKMDTVYTFETWIESSADRDNLFNELKPIVDQYGEFVDWHQCSHNNSYASKPCVISDMYVRR